MGKLAALARFTALQTRFQDIQSTEFEIKLGVRAGRDPMGEVRAKRKLAERGVTLCAVIEKWTAASRAGSSGDTARLYASTLRKDVLPRFGEREVESITRAEWSDLLIGVRTRAPATATLLRRIIGSVLSWAVDAELLSAVNLPSAKRTAPRWHHAIAS
jgi:integrase-like protein